MGTSKSLTLDKMKILCMLTVSLLGLSVARHRHVDGDLDENDNLNVDDFEYRFNKKRVVDPVERGKRQKSLRRNEEIVRDVNEDFINGQETWFAKVYSFADETEEEVLKERLVEKYQTICYVDLEDFCPLKMKEEITGLSSILKGFAKTGPAYHDHMTLLNWAMSVKLKINAHVVPV